MKQKDFYYSTLYIYDKTLNDALTADFAESNERSKSKYLTDLISLGLTAKKQRAELSDCDKTADLYGKLTVIEKRLEELQRFILSDQTEKEIYRILLCNVYYLLDSIAYGEVFNGECLDAGLYDVLPHRLYKQLNKLKETCRRAA